MKCVVELIGTLVPVFIICQRALIFSDPWYVILLAVGKPRANSISKALRLQSVKGFKCKMIFTERGR